MANVSFKRGLQADLPNSNIVDGAFYLTTDTNRLYVGGANNKLELLNQSIKFYTYDQVFREDSTVPKVEGQFYYLRDKNILCTFAKTETNPDGEWVQINPDHNDNDDTYISSLTVAPVDTSETDKLIYEITIGQKTRHQGKGESTVTPDITAQLEINSKDLNEIVSNVAVGVAADAITGNDNGFVLKTTGGGADADTNIAIVGGENVNVGRSENGKTITIKSHDTKTSIKSVSAGNDGRIGVTYAQDNEEHTAYSNAELYYRITVDGKTETIINNQGSLGTFYSSSKVDELIRQAAANMNAMTYKGVVASDTFATTVAGAQKGDTYKANGEIVIGSQTAKTGDLIIYKGDDLADGRAPENTDFDVIPSGDEIDSQFALSGTGNAIVLTNTTNKNNPAAGSVSVSGADGISAEVTNNTLSIKHTNAISKGSVGESGNVSPAAGNSFTIPSISYDAQGHITNASNVTVTLPADKDTTYSLGTAVGDARYDAYINLTPVGSSGAGVTSAKFKAGANIAITGSGDKITVAHSGPGDATGNVVGNNTKTTLDYEDTFIIPKITKDANGHIVSADNVELALPKAVAIPTISYAGTTTKLTDANRVIMSSSLTVGNSAVKTYSPSIGSSTLNLSTDGDNITMDLEWGSF